MAAGTRYPIVLDPDLREQLERIANARGETVGLVRRAQVLLARANQERVRDTCARLRCSSGFMAKVCARFCSGGWLAAQREDPRGAPARRPAEENQRVRELAQTPPSAHGLPHTRWSLSLLQQTLEPAAPDQPPPSRSTLRRWLHAASLPWWRVRSWCTSNDPDFEAKQRAVCDAYLYAPAQWAVLCYDQTPHLQALGRRVAHRACRRGRPARREHDYKRCGTADLHCLLDTRTGHCQARMAADHTQQTIAKFLFDCLRQRPEKHIILVMDNLSANHAPAVRAALDRLGKVVLVLRTPTHSSWLNQVERVFADLKRQVLDLLEANSIFQLARAVRGWFRVRNRSAKPYSWRYHPDSRLAGAGH